MNESPTPKLWNPNAATLWSLIFSPVFGAWIHAKNWEELGVPEESKNSMKWVYGGLVFLVLILIVPMPDALGRYIGLGFLIAWNFSSATKQVDYVKSLPTYEKKAWSKPLLAGLCGIFVYFTVAFGLTIATEPSLTTTLESKSVSMVTQIIKEQSSVDTRCNKVEIVKELPDKSYQAIAYLENGNTLKISIKIQGDQFYVEIPAQ